MSSWEVDSGSWSESILEANSITSLDNLWFISISEQDIKDISLEEREISGEVLDPAVEKITVDFENRDSKFPRDSYTLKTYKQWDSSFRYLASAHFKVLDFWENIYTFSAYKWDQISQIKVKIYVSKESQESDTQKNSNDVFASLPVSKDLGDPIKIWDSAFTYSQIKWFLAQKEEVSSFDCSNGESVTQYLVQKYGYTYWNTCRPLVPGKVYSLNILRLENENYLYEKYYIDTYNSLTANYLLQTWTGSKETLESKNSELKEKNFPESEKVSELFKTLAR